MVLRWGILTARLLLLLAVGLELDDDDDMAVGAMTHRQESLQRFERGRLDRRGFRI